MTIADIISSRCWSSERLVSTRKGPMFVKTMPVQGWHYEVQRSNFDAFRAAGLSFGSSKTGKPEICCWRHDEGYQDREDASRASDATLPIPAPSGMEYLPFQRAGVAYVVAAKEGVIIADEMGLGKTVQAIGALNLSRAEGPGWDRALIICPASLKINWRNELRRWLADEEIEVHVVEGFDKDKPHPYPVVKNGITIINYDLLAKFPHILKERWHYLIIDEAHYIKSKDAARTKHTLSIESDHFMALTGTPLMNKPVELWTLLHRAAPTVFPDYFRFVKRYCNAFKEEKDMGRKGLKSVWNVTGASNLGELQKIMRQHCMIRRLKKDVLKELPKKRRQVIELPPTSSMRVVMSRENDAWKLHEETIAAFSTRRARALISEDEHEYRAAVDGLKSAWQIAFKDMAKVRKETALAKLPLVEQHLEDVLESEDKVIVFAHHREVLDQLEKTAKDRGWNPIKIDGGVSPHLRQGLVEKFQKDPTCRCAVLSIMAAGVGLTLTAACVEVFAEMDWNPALLSQAEDRAHRIGQTNPVLVQHMVLESSLDAKMIRTVMKKQAIADAALDKRSRPAAGLAAGDSDQPVAKVTKYREIGDRLSMDQAKAVSRAIEILCENDKDRASAANGKGFNRFDSGIGHELNLAKNGGFWSEGRLGFAYQLARKYRTQLPTALLSILNFE